MQFAGSFLRGKGPQGDAFRKLIDDSDAHCATKSFISATCSDAHFNLFSFNYFHQ
jgi:hypothetical protein